MIWCVFSWSGCGRERGGERERRRERERDGRRRERGETERETEGVLCSEQISRVGQSSELNWV